MPTPAPDILAAALEAYDAGLCTIRARVDGTKAPLGKWEQYQHARPTRGEVEAWFADGHPGLGVVCGNVSGDLEMFELEGRFMQQHAVEFLDRIKAAGIELLFRRLNYQMESPKGGRNFVYRVDGPVEGNTKLARGADGETLIETRGEGGFIVLAPSHGPTHPTRKPWVIRKGSVANIPTITTEEREALFAVARSFDEAPVVTPPPPTSTQRTKPSAWTGGQVGESWFDAVTDHLAATETVRAVLERHGWTFCYTDGRGRQLLRRPGKDEGVSGSINENGRFCPFSTSVPFPSGGGGKVAPTYDVLDVIATYEFGGDREHAARHHAEATGILDAWKAQHELRIKPSEQPPPTVDPATGEIARPTPMNLPDEFWARRPSLQHIRQAAHSRARSADAVLISTLARVIALIPPSVKLPPIVGAAASLNFLAAPVGTSGAGKTTAVEVARELVPIKRTDVVADMPLGSGEGLIELYFEWVSEEQPDGKKAKVKRQTKSAAFMTLDEGQALGEMGSRKGATLLPALRTAWSGMTLGQANASQETHRVLPPHTYRLSLIVGFQADYAVHLLDDAAGGTPQRFVFCAANDPNVPDEPPEWPGPLPIEQPVIMGGEQIVHFDPEIAAGIRQRAVMATRGELVASPLDSHADLVREKVAAALAYIDGGRQNVSIEDWELAGDVMEASGAVRAWVVDLARQKADQTAMAANRRFAEREAVIATEAETRALKAAARAVARKIRRENGPLGKTALRHAIAGKYRQHVSVEEAIEEAERRGWVQSDGDLGWVAGEGQPA